MRKQDRGIVPAIVFVATVLEGGIGKNIVRLANNFYARGLRVSVWVEDPTLGYVKDLDTHIRLIHLSTTHPLTGVWEGWKAIRSLRPALVVVSNERLARLIYSVRRLSLLDFAVVAWVHNIYSQHFLRLNERKRQRRIERIGKLYPKLNGIVAVSERVAEDLSGLTDIPKSSVTTIYNPVVESSWFNLDFSSGKELYSVPTIINVGRLVPQKNISLLLQSFAWLRERMDCRLEIVGDGESIGLLKAQAAHMDCAKDIIFVGHQSDPRPYLQRASVFALTSVYEGFGNVVVEALACGIPVVATQCGGPEEILRQDWLGEVVEDATAEKFGGTLLKWLNRSVDAPSLQRYAQDNFSVDAIADQYYEFFSTMVDELSHV